MKHVSMLMLTLGLAMGVSAQAADQVRDREQVRDQTRATEQVRTQDRERIYGSELMTRRERLEYHRHMRALKTEREREAFRLEHHQQMQERARAQGKTLPDMPPAGMGPGSGMGPGGGMGPGSGMGGGRR